MNAWLRGRVEEVCTEGRRALAVETEPEPNAIVEPAAKMAAQYGGTMQDFADTLVSVSRAMAIPAATFGSPWVPVA